MLPVQHVPDDELVKMVKRGRRDAFNEIVNRYQSKIINIAYGMLSSEDDAFDAAQEVFIRVYKSLGEFNGESLLSTWIYRITTNICNDILRKRQRTVQTTTIEHDEDEDSPILHIRDKAPTPEERLEQKEHVRVIREALNEMSEDSRTVLVLFDIQGLSYDEITEALDLPLGTVKSRLSRARTQLRKILLEKGELF